MDVAKPVCPRCGEPWPQSEVDWARHVQRLAGRNSSAPPAEAAASGQGGAPQVKTKGALPTTPAALVTQARSCYEKLSELGYDVDLSLIPSTLDMVGLGS